MGFVHCGYIIVLDNFEAQKYLLCYGNVLACMWLDVDILCILERERVFFLVTWVSIWKKTSFNELKETCSPVPIIL
jgi:hypothetical protein